MLNLISLGKFPAGGTGGGYMADKYLVNFHFVGSDIGVGNLSVMEANLEKRPFKMLIGRDILSNAIFVYNGINGILEIRIVPPGMQSPKKPVNHPVKPPMPSSQNRAARRQAEKKKGKKKR
ncbi:MAG: hypothetical protein KKG33_07535 [candidate division Zixibacteria bacterium]|nr:hypothetical protein [candidate division Zixibacteria bacterium]